ALPVQAQQKFDIKFKKSAKGDVYLIEKAENTEVSTLIQDQAGKALKEEKKKSVESYAFRETILEKTDSDRRATKLRREYTKAETTAEGKTTQQPFHGKTVLIEKKGDKYHFH